MSAMRSVAWNWHIGMHACTHTAVIGSIVTVATAARAHLKLFLFTGFDIPPVYRDVLVPVWAGVGVVESQAMSYLKKRSEVEMHLS